MAEGTAFLKFPAPDASIDTPALDASLLLAETLRMGRTDLIGRGNDPIGEAGREQFFRLLKRRRSGECTAYILGRREFRGLDFCVNRQVLVPRPDTETLVEAALEHIDSMYGEEKNPSLLDLCTGSGAVAISLKNERHFLTVSASDIFTEALTTAAHNAARLLDGSEACRITQSVRFIESDIFEKIPDGYNIIVSNPPYVRTGELSALAPEVRQEPSLALDGGSDGLDLIRKIISRAQDHLLKPGVLLLEAGPEQMPAVKILLEENGFRGIMVYKDLAGRDRVISGRS